MFPEKKKKFKAMAPLRLLPTAVIFIVISIIVLTLGAKITADTQSQMTAASAAYNVAGNGLSALQTMGSNLPLIGLVVMASIVILVLVVYLGGVMGGGKGGA